MVRCGVPGWPRSGRFRDVFEQGTEETVDVGLDADRLAFRIGNAGHRRIKIDMNEAFGWFEDFVPERCRFAQSAAEHQGPTWAVSFHVLGDLHMATEARDTEVQGVIFGKDSLGTWRSHDPRAGTLREGPDSARSLARTETQPDDEGVGVQEACTLSCVLRMGCSDRPSRTLLARTQLHGAGLQRDG